MPMVPVGVFGWSYSNACLESLLRNRRRSDRLWSSEPMVFRAPAVIELSITSAKAVRSEYPMLSVQAQIGELLRCVERSP